MIADIGIMGGIFLALLCIILALVVFLFFKAHITNIKLYLYLKKMHYNRWVELTSLMPGWPGGSNPFRWFPYLGNELDTEDAQILKYKNSIRINLKVCFSALVIFFAGIICFIIYLYSQSITVHP